MQISSQFDQLEDNKMMEKIVLFGGTFDPPHLGHMALLQATIDAVQPDRVIVMPTGTPPHKEAHAVSAQLRVEMCACFCTLDARVEISTQEIERGGKSYTLDTLHALQTQYPSAKLYLPMGSDMLLYFPKWHRYEQVLQCATLVVQCREDGDVAPVQKMVQELEQKGAEILFTKASVYELSSTQVRKAVQTGQAYQSLVPECVAMCIAQHHLYQSSGDMSNDF